jgi:hypothetical protein
VLGLLGRLCGARHEGIVPRVSLVHDGGRGRGQWSAPLLPKHHDHDARSYRTQHSGVWGRAKPD